VEELAFQGRVKGILPYGLQPPRLAVQGRIFRVAAVSLLLLLGEPTNACSLASGHFHQVTQLNGRVVGRSLGPVQFRWLRRMFSVSGAEMKLYFYTQPWDRKQPAMARVTTNSAGEFEFANIGEGHYRLEISSDNLQDLFDVEVTSKVSPTQRMVIDISPIFPDCTGGHEFEVKTKEK
jgi:hypothetical protein